MGWIVECYVRVEVEEPEVFASEKEAESEAKHLESLQPENIYRVKEVK